MPESRWITHSVRNPKPSLPTVTWPENPPSKYLAVASAIRALMRAHKASPTSMFLPETRNDMKASDHRCIDLTLHRDLTLQRDGFAASAAPERPRGNLRRGIRRLHVRTPRT